MRITIRLALALLLITYAIGIGITACQRARLDLQRTPVDDMAARCYSAPHCV